MSRRHILSRLKHGALLLVATLTACSTPEPRDPPVPLGDFKPAAEVRKLWSTPFGDSSGRYDFRYAPVTDGALVYIADRRGRVGAVDIHKGETVWAVESEQPIANTASISGAGLFIGTQEGHVLAFNKNTGEMLWRAAVSSEVLAPVRVAQGRVVVVAVDGKVTALNETNGQRLWVHDESVPVLTLRGSSAPLIDGDAVYVGFANGRLIALNLQDGKLIWDVTIAIGQGRSELARMVDIDADPVLYRGVIYVAAFQGQVAAVQQSTGRILWSRELSSHAGIAVDDKQVFVTDAVGDLWSLDRGSGDTLWKQTALHQRGLTRPALQGDWLVVGDQEGYLHWLAKEDGHFVARSAVRNDFEPVDYSARIVAAPLVVNRSVFTYDSHGRLHAWVQE